VLMGACRVIPWGPSLNRPVEVRRSPAFTVVRDTRGLNSEIGDGDSVLVMCRETFTIGCIGVSSAGAAVTLFADRKLPGIVAVEVLDIDVFPVTERPIVLRLCLMLCLELFLTETFERLPSDWLK
jgi:hypothetical protein